MADKKNNILKETLDKVNTLFENIDCKEVKVDNKSINQIKLTLENNIVQIVYVKENVPTMAVVTSNKVLINEYLKRMDKGQSTKTPSGVKNVFSKNIKTFNLLTCQPFSWPLKYRTAIISHETIIPDNTEKLNNIITNVSSHSKIA